MEELERQRLLLLESEAERQNGLIVIIALRDFGLIPQEIRDRRLCKNFEPYTLKANMRRNSDFQRDVIEISTYISERVRVFERRHKLVADVNSSDCRTREEYSIGFGP